MELIEMLDEFIEDALAHGYSEAQITTLLLDEDCVLRDDKGYIVPLLETVRRTRMKRGGVNITVRKMGRPNPMRSQKAKMAARKSKTKRLQAARRYQRSPKAKQVRRVVSQMKRNRRPSFKRPKVRRPKMSFKRPKVRRVKSRRPTARRPKVRRPTARRHGPPRRSYRRR